MTPRPMYMQIPVEEYENTAKKLLDAAAVIIEKDKEIESLKYSVATLDTDIAMLKRWRKFSEEKPEHHQWILVFYPNHSKFTTGVELRRWDDGCKYDVEVQEIYDKWMPLPEPPEAK